MTAGQAIEQADEMRPNNEFSDGLKQNWLRQCDARLRSSVVQRSTCSDFDAVGADKAWADGLTYDTELLAPEEFGPLYPTGCARRWTWRWARRPGPRTSCRCTATMCRSLPRGCGGSIPGGRGAVEVLTPSHRFRPPDGGALRSSQGGSLV